MNIVDALKRAKEPGFVRSVGILTSGTMLANALGVLTTPIVSRLYSPQDFGMFAVVMSVATVVTALTSLGMQSAIVRATSDTDSLQVFKVALLSSGLLTAGLVAVAVVFGMAVDVTGQMLLPFPTLCVLVGVLGFLSSANGSLRSLSNRRGANRVLFVNYLVGAISTLAITVPLGVLGAGSLGLIAGSLGSMLICNVQMVLRLRPLGAGLRLLEVKQVFRRNTDFVRFQYPANLVETVSAQAPRQAISFMFGSTAVGLYAMTDKILGIPLRLVGAPVGTVYFREASRRDLEKRNLTSFTMAVVVQIMGAAYVPIIIMVLWGQPLFAWVLGTDWAPAGALAGVMIAQYIFAVTRTSVGSARVVLNRQSVNLVMSAVRLVVEVGALAIGGYTTRDPLQTLIFFSMASTLFYIFDMTVTFRMMGTAHVRYLGGALLYAASIFGILLVSGGFGRV